MTTLELSKEVKNWIAIILLPLSTLVLLASEILHRLSLLADADPGIIHAIASVIGWVVLILSLTYLFVGLRTSLPVVDFTE